jgi:hypothetical protein
MSEPRTLSDMLRVLSAQALGMWVSGDAPTPTDMMSLSRTLDACANAAADLEAERSPPTLPALLPENVIPFRRPRAHA